MTKPVVPAVPSSDALQGHDGYAWQQLLEDSPLVSTGRVLERLNGLLQRKDCSAGEIAAVIEQDAAMAARVLQVANAVAMQRGENHRGLGDAVARLGIQGLKSICISLVLLDSLRQRPAIRQRLTRCLSRAFHAGVQARLLLGDDNDEEVFVAALLRHLGELVFWSGSLSDAEDLCARVNRGQISADDAVAEMLGTGFDEITVYFAQRWQISDLLVRSLVDEHPDKKLQAIRLADRISSAVAEGWTNPAFRAVVSELAETRGCSETQAFHLIRDGVHRTIALAQHFSAADISRFLKVSEQDISAFLAEAEVETEAEALHPIDVDLENQRVMESIADTVERSVADHLGSASELGGAQVPGQADLGLQMSVIDTLWRMVDELADVNAIFNMMSDGMHRSLGMERVAIALTSPDRLKLKAKYIRGENTQIWRDDFEVAIDNPKGNLLAYCLHQGQPLLSRVSDSSSLRGLLTPVLVRKLGCDGDMMLAPIFSGTRAVAVFYADRDGDGRAIQDAQYQSFCRFAQQASAALTLLANRRAS